MNNNIIFSNLDNNNDNYLSRNEFNKLINNYNFDFIDKNKSKYISKKEFKKFLNLISKPYKNINYNNQNEVNFIDHNNMFNNYNNNLFNNQNFTVIEKCNKGCTQTTRSLCKMCIDRGYEKCDSCNKCRCKQFVVNNMPYY